MHCFIFRLKLNTCKWTIITYSAARTDARGKFIVIINYVLLLARFHLSIRIGQKKPHTLCCGGINYSYIPAGLQAAIDLSIKTLIYNSITGRRDRVHNAGKMVSGSPVEARATTATTSTSLIFTHAEEQRRDGPLLRRDGKNRHAWLGPRFAPLYYWSTFHHYVTLMCSPHRTPSELAQLWPR